MYCCIPGRLRKIRPEIEAQFNLSADVSLFVGAYIERMADIRVLIVDDVERVRQDLRTFLTLAGNIDVIGEASNGREAVNLVRLLEPQVVLMDLEMPILDGYAATRQIKSLQPSCRVIALTIHTETTEQQRAAEAGVDVFVIKGAPMETLVEAVFGAST